MGLRFRATLRKKKKTKQTVICTSYRSISEFENISPQGTVYVPVPTKRKTQETNKNEDENEIATLQVQLPESNTSEVTKVSPQQPKSILKKISNHSPDLDEYKKSTPLSKTENHDNDDESSAKRIHLEADEELDKSDNKAVNWRKTVEYISLQETPPSPTQNRNESQDDIDQEEYYENSTSYSDQAASIFFSRDS